jgi:hypothetical protein
MVRDEIISMGANPFRGPLEGVSPENRDFFGPEIATSIVRGSIYFVPPPLDRPLYRTI